MSRDFSEFQFPFWERGNQTGELVLFIYLFIFSFVCFVLFCFVFLLFFFYFPTVQQGGQVSLF